MPWVYISIDGVDFAINEPQYFRKKWYSQKFKSAEIRNEIDISIATGPFPCGCHTDLWIFRQDLKQRLIENKRVFCAQRYQDDVCLNKGDIAPQSRHVFTRQRAKHECLNSRMKMFIVLSHRYRHNILRPNYCSFAVLDIVFLSMFYGESVFRD